ncbi:uncharacterized protein LOC142627867 [Castanea sativa]|uniref:uncharacterized protein LOC142627867 n=1 Tax=Castanea sativa TaxID=21020 RepID=UPI003F64BDB2
MSQAKEKLAEFCVTLPPILPAAPKPKVRWKPPDVSLVKINFDGTIFREENRSGIGVVIQNHIGAILVSLAQTVSTALQPAEIEAIAATRALEFGHELGLTEAVLEGDSELIINSLKARDATVALVEPLIQDAIIFSCLFTKLQYSHCRRDGNKLAHSLARFSIHVFDYTVWMEEVPRPLLSVAQHDVANLAI